MKKIKQHILLIAVTLVVIGACTPIQATGSVEDYGVVGDGIVDDTVALQNKINQGGDIYIGPPNIIIKLTNTIHLPSNIQIHIDKNVTLKMTGGVAHAIFYAQNQANIEIDGGIFDGNKKENTNHPEEMHAYLYNNALLSIDRCENVVIKNVTTINSQMHGFRAFGCSNLSYDSC